MVVAAAATEVDVMAVADMEEAVMAAAVDMEEVVEDTEEVAVDMVVEEDTKQSTTIASAALKHIIVLYFFKNTNRAFNRSSSENSINFSHSSLYFFVFDSKTCISKDCSKYSKLTMKLSLTLSMVCGF